MKVYYTPTGFNKKLAQAAKERLPGTYEFQPLSRCGAFRRHWQLKRIKEPAVFIWGSGWSHHESYYFTGKKLMAKAIIDQHGDDLEYSRGERARGVRCFNHVLASARLGVETFGIASSRTESVQAPQDFSEGKIAVSIDFDCIPFFPASPIWALTEGKGGFPLEAVAKFVGDWKPRISMLDMGGVAENSPDFSVQGKMRTPTQFEISEYCSRLKARQPVEKGIADVVLNYALDAYLAVLGAFTKREN